MEHNTAPAKPQEKANSLTDLKPQVRIQSHQPSGTRSQRQRPMLTGPNGTPSEVPRPP